MAIMNLEDEEILRDADTLRSAIRYVDVVGLAGCGVAVRKMLRDGASVAQVNSVVEEVAGENEASAIPASSVRRAVAFLQDELEHRYYWDEFFSLHG